MTPWIAIWFAQRVTEPHGTWLGFAIGNAILLVVVGIGLWVAMRPHK